MKCELLMYVGNEETPIKFIFDSESSSLTPTDKEYFEAITNSLNEESRKTLLELVENNYFVNNKQILDLDKFDGKPIKFSGNTSLQVLSKMFTGASFPEGVTANVLLINNLKQGGKHISGRRFDINGEELFVVQNTEEDVGKLANFLTIRKTLEDNPNILDDDPNLKKLATLYKRKAVSDLIIDFIEDIKAENKRNTYNSDFRTEYFTTDDGKVMSAYTYLDDVCRDILQWAPRKQFVDPTINTLFRLHRTFFEQGRQRGENKKKYFGVKYSDIYLLLKTYHSDILDKLGITDLKSFTTKIKEDFNNEYIIEDKNSTKDSKKGKIFENVVEGKPLMYTLFEYIKQNEPFYRFEIKNLDSNKLNLIPYVPTIKNRFGYSYSQLQKNSQLLEPDPYKGYWLYQIRDKDTVKYIYSRHYITDDTSVFDEYDSLEELKQAISEKALNEKIKTQSLRQFKFRKKIDGKFVDVKYLHEIEKGNYMLTLKSIVGTLEINLDPNTVLKIENERELISPSDSEFEPTVKDVHNVILTWNIDNNYKQNIINYIDNAEKAFAYIYKINEVLKDKRTNGKKLTEIAKQISEAEPIYYYVDSETSNKYKLIPTDPNTVKSFKQNRQAPVLKLFESLETVLKEKVGVNINILTALEIFEKFPKDKFPGIDPNTSKAFIHNGQIYINSTIASGEDLLHEYLHIILGALRVNPETREHYENLLLNVGKKSYKALEKIAKLYPSDLFSRMDQLEELFVSQFSKYLFNNLDFEMKDLESIFKKESSFLEEETKSIFNMLGSESLSEIYTGSIDFVFRKFSSDINELLNQEDSLQFNKITDSRRIQDWIRKEINNKNIKELDCV